ncbi:MAG: hypothetical protein MI725_00045 [Pirellulales bacterium]|nr:hypothetical protein [Pirellulales bacterium]
MKLPKFDRSEITLAPAEMDQRTRQLLDDNHRDLAWIRASLIALLYLLLSGYNLLYLDDTQRVTATVFSMLVVVIFVLFACLHRFVEYPASQTNLVTFGELTVLQADAIAFSIVTDALMGSFGVYFMIIGAGIFMTTARWVIASGVMLLSSWAGALVVMGMLPDLGREGMLLVASLFGAYFFYSMRVRSSRRLAEHQLMEEKYKDTLEQALEHIETLSGLLPICANCKAIRIEENVWTELDIYIRDRSEVEFTHSVCPTCREELYPELN